MALPDLTPYFNAAAAGASASQITGVTSDAVTAGAYAAWIQSITGSVPQVIANGKQARLVLTQAQIISMQKWLDAQLSKSLQKQAAARVSMELRPVFTPVALKYTVPVAALAVVAGWLLHYYLSR